MCNSVVISQERYCNIKYLLLFPDIIIIINRTWWWSVLSSLLLWLGWVGPPQPQHSKERTLHLVLCFQIDCCCCYHILTVCWLLQSWIHTQNPLLPLSLHSSKEEHTNTSRYIHKSLIIMITHSLSLLCKSNRLHNYKAHTTAWFLLQVNRRM